MYVSQEEFQKAIKDLSGQVEDIKDNHLPSIQKEIASLAKTFADKVNILRWVFIAGMATLGVVLGLLQVFG